MLTAGRGFDPELRIEPDAPPALGLYGPYLD